MAYLRTFKRKALFLGVISSLWVAGVGFRFAHSTRTTSSGGLSVQHKPFFSKAQMNTALKTVSFNSHFPSNVNLDVKDYGSYPVTMDYTFDSKLQETMASLFEAYNPDYGAFVALDPATGRVLSIISYSRSGTVQGNLALRATFPSASVFKVVTAAAAIEAHKVSANTVLPFEGRRHTLYRNQIFKSNINRWTHFTTFRDAFAHSNNIIFGKLGAFTVGTAGLKDFADRFGFNRSIPSDVPVQEGRAIIPDDAWGLAETASGYTLDNTMSPLQGALIAAAVANDGVMMEPYVIQSARQEDGRALYTGAPKIATIAIDPDTAGEIKKLMRETVLHGTSRGSFKGFFRKEFALLNVGGKTGTLTGMDPYGKCDWFVGYADSGVRRIAVAALTVHGKLWRVKSSFLARRAIETYFKNPSPALKNIAKTGL